MTRILRFLVPFVAAAALVGCATHGGVTTAHPIGKGKVQVGVEPGAGIWATNDTYVAPHLNLALRYGVSRRAEIGVRAGTSMYEVLGKVMFSDPDADVVISIAPSGSLVVLGFQGPPSRYFSYQVPLLFGLPSGESQFVVGPKFRHLVITGVGTSDTSMIFMGGGVFAYSAKLSDTFRLHPELAVDVPFVGSASSVVSSGGGSSIFGPLGGLVVGVNVGLMFGGD